jgi:LCP family protein required for cell wall assembly
LAFLVILAIAWPVGLGLWANSRIQRVDALTSGEDTPGRTYLIAGSDKRGSGGVQDTVTGARTDTIMVLQVAKNGKAALMSLPRDTYVDIPGHDPNRINAAYAFGGPKLLVETVENLTGLHIDHYVEVGFGSVVDLVDAVGGVNLCMDRDVDDTKSRVSWTAGCHDADGALALWFSRMRKWDPENDFGRAKRQRQVVGAVMKKAITPSTFLWPPKQVALLRAGTDAVTVDESTNVIDLMRMALDFKKATGPDGVTGIPTISNPDYRPGNIGSTVLLDEEASARDFRELAEGTWEGTELDK